MKDEQNGIFVRCLGPFLPVKNEPNDGEAGSKMEDGEEEKVGGGGEEEEEEEEEEE